MGSAQVDPEVPMDIRAQLEKLAELRDSGVLTNEEFTMKKQELLARI